jgi:hypothetical protein
MKRACVSANPDMGRQLSIRNLLSDSAEGGEFLGYVIVLTFFLGTLFRGISNRCDLSCTLFNP